MPLNFAATEITDFATVGGRPRHSVHSLHRDIQTHIVPKVSQLCAVTTTRVVTISRSRFVSIQGEDESLASAVVQII